MKIHTDKLVLSDIYEAAVKARSIHGQDLYIADCMGRGSRSRARSCDVRCRSHNGRRATNPGQSGGLTGERAATWTAWGYFIAELFVIDPEAVIGQYKGLADYHRTCNAYQPQGYKTPEARAFLKVCPLPEAITA